MTTTVKAKALRVWHRLLIATHLPVAWYLLYAGIYTLVEGPGPALSKLPEGLTWTWCLALILGASLTTLGTLTGHTRTESAGHGFHIFGLGLYAFLAILTFGFTGGVAVVVLALGGVSLSRMYVLNLARKARIEAARIAGGSTS